MNVWRMPALLGGVTAIGLLLALFADGPSDLASTALLAAPAWVGVWYGYLRRGPR